ncbi:transcription antitermination factor NusB [Salinisphaera aquimarina]|uniref:Transcription antitermination protein NusB n=1 Tax=Salinisphaera aquimarina TaxID=2094031 RepID=A0ABV7ESA2_9GAMM
MIINDDQVQYESQEPDSEEDDALPEPSRKAGGGRVRARMAAVQAIYQWRMSGTEIAELILQFAQARRLRELDREYFETLLRGVVYDAVALEAAFDKHLSRPAAQLDPVEHAILLLATFELRDRVEIPFAAIINEATNLAKIFGATDGHRFINGVLDATARDLRTDEIGARR